MLRFDKRMPKDPVALTSQCLAATNYMLHCFSLLPAESAGPWCAGAFSQEHPCENRNYHVKLMPA
jgi:hypothetical protein